VAVGRRRLDRLALVHLDPNLDAAVVDADVAGGQRDAATPLASRQKNRGPQGSRATGRSDSSLGQRSKCESCAWCLMLINGIQRSVHENERECQLVLEGER